MKILKYFLILSVFISSCKKEDEEILETLPRNYGKGMYILTDQGISYYNYLVVDTLRTVKNNIYQSVNNTNIIQIKSMHISGNSVYIIADKLYIADVQTFGSNGIVSGFSDPVSCVRVDAERLYVVDKGDATIKVVDLNKNEIQIHIQTGDGTMPIKVVKNWFRAIIMNGGGELRSERDSSIVSIDYYVKNEGIVVNNFSGKLDIYYNPNSAVFGTDDLWVLCKGIYDSQNPNDNTESVIYQVYPYNTLSTFFNKTLSGIHNADNLTINNSKNRLFFTAENGVYITDLTIFPILHIANIDASFLSINTEKINDSTTVEYLYTNDANQSGKVLKYEAWSGVPIDTIEVDGNALEVLFY